MSEAKHQVDAINRIVKRFLPDRGPGLAVNVYRLFKYLLNDAN